MNIEKMETENKLREGTLRLYDHNDMAHWKKYIYYPLVLFHNAIINKIPSRHFRRFVLKLLGARFGKGSFLFRRVEVLFPKGLLIGGGVPSGGFHSLTHVAELKSATT